MNTKKSLYWAVMLMAVVTLGRSASAGPFSQMVIFGDSFSDTGNIYSVTSDPVLGTLFSGELPGGEAPGPASPYYAGRFSNGLLWVDYLALDMGLPAPHHDAYVENFEIKTGLGFNYATGASHTGGNAIDPLNMTAQLDRYLSVHTPAGDELFVLFGGGNDIRDGVTDTNAMVGHLTGMINTLYAAGGRNFLVMNLPPMGQLPSYLGTTEATEKDQLAEDFNAAYWTALDTLEEDAQDINLFRVDFHALSLAILVDPAAYGFNNVTDAAVDWDDLTIDNDFDNDYLFWDKIHPSTQTHRLIADAAFAVIPEPATGLVFIGCALVMLGRRQRMS